MDCWSDVLGNCKGPQSEEHYVSQSVIGRSEVTVSGFEFLRGQMRTLPAKRVARNMLCKGHNEALSDLDAAAGHFFEIVKTFMHRAATRARGGRKRGGIDVYNVDGALVERWLLKTVINISYRRETAEGRWAPPELWVRCVHGRSSLPVRCGFYLLQGEGLITPPTEGAFGIRVLNDADQNLIGAQFRMQELQFAVAMKPISGVFRPPIIRDKPSIDVRQVINFDWTHAISSSV